VLLKLVDALEVSGLHALSDSFCVSLSLLKRIAAGI
jgi:hypothetical protein